jgi:mannose-6-phosphate isomerase
VDRLSCTVMPYPWGSRTAIATLTGRKSPSDAPEAELWMGAHPIAPSFVERASARSSLSDVIASAPARELGDDVVRELGPRLPFLLKVLAAAEPLSLQAHPTLAQARAGFEDEERRGIPLSAPHRNYKDPSHKPELLCALTPFEALSGFRRIDETLRLFALLDVRALDPVLAPLHQSPDAIGLAETFRTLMTLPAEARAPVVDAVLAACARPNESFVAERALAARLAALYPGDIGIVSALLLELVHLAPGEAIYLDAGNLHAYLEGTGVEIMASSDNVLRGGLTKKHVDVPELLRVLDFGAGPAKVLRARRIDEHESAWDTPAREFRLSKIALGDAPVTRAVVGPEILLAVDGAPSSEGLAMPKGSAVFVPADTGEYTLAGTGTVYRATTNLR